MTAASGGTTIPGIETPSGRPFREDAAETVARLRRAFADVVQALPGGPQRAHEIEKVLEIDRTLAWKIARLLSDDDAFSAARYIPKPAATRLFLDAAARKGVPASRIESARAAASDFEQLAKSHADDRSTLETMLDGCAPQPDPQAGLAHKRAAFRANRHLRGLHAKVRLVTCIVQPSAKGGHMDCAWIRGYVDLRWLRGNARWAVSVFWLRGKDGQTGPQGAREPIDERSASLPIPLMQSYCSNPLPEFRREEIAPAVVQDEMVSNGVGSTAGVTFFTGEVIRGVGSLTRDKHHTRGNIGALITVPSELLLLDLLVREDTFGPIRPEVVVFNRAETGSVPFTDADKLHVSETVDYLGTGLGRLPAGDIPRYREMYASVFEKLGWQADRFEVHRCRVEYPITPSTVMTRFELPERR